MVSRWTEEDWGISSAEESGVWGCPLGSSWRSLGIPWSYLPPPPGSLSLEEGGSDPFWWPAAPAALRSQPHPGPSLSTAHAPRSPVAGVGLLEMARRFRAGLGS